MGKIYAQVLKQDMKVNLIGGKAMGLPIVHPAVIVIDITNRSDKDSIQLYMTYDEKADIFAYVQEEPLPIEPVDDSNEPATKGEIRSLQRDITELQLMQLGV